MKLACPCLQMIWEPYHFGFGFLPGNSAHAAAAAAAAAALKSVTICCLQSRWIFVFTYQMKISIKLKYIYVCEMNFWSNLFGVKRLAKSSVVNGRSVSMCLWLKLLCLCLTIHRKKNA